MSFAKKSLQSGFVVPPLPLLILLTILAAIPLTVIVSQQQQEIRQRAAVIQPPPSPSCSSFKTDKTCTGNRCVWEVDPDFGGYCTAPIPTPTPTPTPTPKPKGNKCSELKGQCTTVSTACNSLGSYVWGGYGPDYCPDSGKPQCCIPVPTPTQTPTPTPTPPAKGAPTATPTSAPTQVGCGLWVTFGQCGFFDCKSNEKPQTRDCPGGIPQTRCMADSSCPLLTPTPTSKVVSISTPTPAPILTPTRIPTPAPTLAQAKLCVDANVNRDGTLDKKDFDAWLNSYKQPGISLADLALNGIFPDVNQDKIVNLLDFNLWFYAMKTCKQQNQQ